MPNPTPKLLHRSPSIEYLTQQSTPTPIPPILPIQPTHPHSSNRLAIQPPHTILIRQKQKQKPCTKPKPNTKPNMSTNTNMNMNMKKGNHIRKSSMDRDRDRNGCRGYRCQIVGLDDLRVLRKIVGGNADGDGRDGQLGRFGGNSGVKGSPLYKKLLSQLQTLKKTYNTQIQTLQSELSTLTDQIHTEKTTILNFIKKRQKLDHQLHTLTEYLFQLQEKNYERYWDVAARLGNQVDQYEQGNQQQQGYGYEQLLDMQERVGSVGKGLSQKDLEKVISRGRRENKVKGNRREFISEGNIKGQSCCICCQEIGWGQQICSLPCGHTHHTNCIRSWLTINKVCPLCRAQIIL